jgi:elongation factor Ts
MVEVNASMIKELRARTNAGIMDCKEALQEAGGDMEKAVDFLRKKGLATALNIHTGGKLGVLVEVNCETDFVGKTDVFTEFVRNIAMHIAATRPLGIGREDVPEEVIRREEDIYRAQAKETGKPEKILDKIVEGKMEKFYKEACLLEQQYVKDTDLTIQDLINEMVAKTGESISVRRFVRYQLGGE